MTTLLLLFACSSSEPGAETAPPDDGGMDLGVAEPEACGYTAAPDLDPDPSVMEVALTAAPFEWDPGTGVPLTEGLAFNGEVPGPVIEVERGQTLRVTFTNGLDYDNTVHWHGLRVPDAMDGAIRMTDMVMPGDSFTYEFPMVDTGYYWYHPHMSTEQDLERGLYGRIVSHHPDEPRARCDLPVVLDDILLEDDQVAPEDTPHGQLMGRLGNLLLANGRSDRRVLVRAGERNILRLVNASNARYWDLGLAGAALELLATDGGWLPEPVPLERIALAPGERVIVGLTLEGDPGESFPLMNARVHLHDADAHMSEYDPMGEGENPVMDFVIDTEPGEATALVLPQDDAPSLTDPGTTAHTWVLQEEMEDGIVTIDGESYPDVPLVTVPGNQLTAFEVQNDSEMHHPFHLHGNRFQILSIDGVSPAYGGWKDTFDVPPYATVRIASDLDNPGEWMYHCHILEHAELGMAGYMTVE